MEQSLTWLDLTALGALSGKIALELGSAPGGASWALLQRGMKVIGVDTGAMDPRVLAHPNYTHLPIPAGEVSPRDLPPQIDLLASDMNLHPGLALKYVERLTHMLYPRWLALTLKINDGQVESQLPALLQQARRFAPGELHARQLPANRREITVISR
jgi:23S rRNA (cytidine2498-2'-O)-methyltransferase